MTKVTITAQYDESAPLDYDTILEQLTEQGLEAIEIDEEEVKEDK